MIPPLRSLVSSFRAEDLFFYLEETKYALAMMDLQSEDAAEGMLKRIRQHVAGAGARDVQCCVGAAQARQQIERRILAEQAEISLDIAMNVARHSQDRVITVLDGIQYADNRPAQLSMQSYI